MKYTLRDLKGYPFSKKLQYIWDYYKLHLSIAGIILIAAVSVLHRHLTEKEPVLYLAAVNMVAGESLREELTEGFVDFEKKDPEKSEVIYYSDLYLTDDHSDPNYQYAYGSEIKLLGMIEAEKLDVVLTDQKSYNAFSRQGYIYDLNELFEDEIPDEVRLTGIISNESPLFQSAGFSDDLYIGVIKNTPRMEAARSFLIYLFR